MGAFFLGVGGDFLEANLFLLVERLERVVEEGTAVPSGIITADGGGGVGGMGQYLP